MLERDSYPAGVPCWVDTDQPDVAAAVEFYGGLFGWEFEDRMPADSPHRYYVATLRGRAVAGVGLRPENAPPSPVAWNMYVAVESADAAASAVEGAGGTVAMAPFDVLDAGRMAVFSDPAGAAFCVWQAKGTSGAQLVNEPGTWNFNELNTPDPDGAKAFYGAVFGWEPTGLDLGDGDATMWRRPGYGDFLAERDPDLRARMAESKAPPGFEDAVAWLVPMTDGRPPHWSVTFAVDDADAAAARAAELGAEVVMAPTDAPYVRLTVVRDPQGAMLTLSKFVPPS